MILPSIIDIVGKTPAVRLDNISRISSLRLAAKLEFLNPSGSTKDRVIRKAVADAEADGTLLPGGVIIDSSSGNFAIAMSAFGASRGYRVICVVDPDLTPEARAIILALGGELDCITECDNSGSYLTSRILRRNYLLETVKGAWSPDQYNNQACVDAHYFETGREILTECGSDLAAVVIPVGTGCTISGCARAIKEKAPKVKIIAVDALGSQIFSSFKQRRFQRGVGSGFMAEKLKNLDTTLIDEVRIISDCDAFLAARALTRYEGILSGGSAGTALFGALTLSNTLGKNEQIVILCSDRMERYFEEFCNDNWMKSHGFHIEHSLDFLRARVSTWIENAKLSYDSGCRIISM